MPMLYPGDPAEALDLGRHAVAMSRVIGLWTALKIVADVADGTASVELDTDRVQPVMPRSPTGASITAPRKAACSRRSRSSSSARSTRSATSSRRRTRRRTGLNRVTADSPDAWIGIVASGITYREVREALRAARA